MQENYKDMSKKVTPFGGGARLCPGAELAKVVISFFLHHLVLTYRYLSIYTYVINYLLKLNN